MRDGMRVQNGIFRPFFLKTNEKLKLMKSNNYTHLPSVDRKKFIKELEKYQSQNYNGICESI